MSDLLGAVKLSVSRHMDEILAHFAAGAKITVIVRNPGDDGDPEGRRDFLMTGDDLELADAAMARALVRRGLYAELVPSAEARPTTVKTEDSRQALRQQIAIHLIANAAIDLGCLTSAGEIRSGLATTVDVTIAARAVAAALDAQVVSTRNEKAAPVEVSVAVKVARDYAAETVDDGVLVHKPAAIAAAEEIADRIAGLSTQPAANPSVSAGDAEACTCQRFPSHQANDCPHHGLEPPFDGTPPAPEAPTLPEGMKPLNAASVDEREKVLFRAFKLIDDMASRINGVVPEPSQSDDEAADVLAGDLADAFGVVFDSEWPQSLARALAAKGDA